MEPRPGLWHAVVLTLLGHGAVLTYVGTRPPPAAPQGAMDAPAQVLRVRAIQPRAIQAQALAAAPEPTQPREVQEAPALHVAGAAAAAARVAAPREEPPAVKEAAAAQANPPPEPPYIPRGQLTVVPRLVAPVQVPFPEDVKGIVDLQVQVTLFIDEQGRVQRIRVDTPQVHPAFERAVQESFGQARFTPGELHQVPVRSQLRLEVAFQAPGAAAQPPSAGSRRSPS